MKKLVATKAAIVFVLMTGLAHAQNYQSWVSATGSGSTCSRSSPCADFSVAQSVTNPGGVVTVLDPSNSFIQFFVSKSLTIRAEGVDGGSAYTPFSGTWITINAGASDVVTLEGLHFSGSGITFTSGGQLHVVRCVFTNSNLSGQAGIRFRPNSASKLTVTDTVITNFGSGTGGGVVINPQSGGTAEVALERLTINGNAFGIAVDGSGSTGGINMTIADSMIANNAQDGIISTTPSGGAPIGVMVTNTKSVNNQFGARAVGPNVTIRVENSKLTGNNTGLSFSSGGALLSAGNNIVEANGTNGTFSGSISPK